MDSNFAPILIITLNRYEKFKVCVESLKKNIYAADTDLFIALDHPLHPDHFDGYWKILEYINTLGGFKSIQIIKRDYNYGIVKNYLDATNYVFSKYDRMIFSEDDNEFSVDYISFMNKCLNAYESDKRIYSISGYNYPVVMPVNYKCPIYLWMGHSAWGFGIWKDRWDQINWNQKFVSLKVKRFLHNYIDVYKIQKIANNYLPALIAMAQYSKIHGDSYICLHQFLHGYYSVFPVISRVRNHGHDGTGNSKSFIINSPYASMEVYTGSSKYDIPSDVKINKSINKLLYNHFKLPIKRKIRFIFNLLYTNIAKK